MLGPTRSCWWCRVRERAMAERVRARRLSDQEGQRLQQIVRRGKHGSIRVRRAMIIMSSASGTPVPAIARLVAADEDTVRDVIHAFNEKGLAALDPQWAGGCPRLISDADVEVIVAAATTRPEKLGLPLRTGACASWCPPGLAGRLDRARTGAADPARPEDLLPAHEDLEGVRRPGPGRQARPDRARHQHLPRPVLRLRSVRALIHPACPRHLLGPAEQAGTAARHVSPHARRPLLPRLLLPGR